MLTAVSVQLSWENEKVFFNKIFFKISKIFLFIYQKRKICCQKFKKSFDDMIIDVLISSSKIDDDDDDGWYKFRSSFTTPFFVLKN